MRRSTPAPLRVGVILVSALVAIGVIAPVASGAPPTSAPRFTAPDKSMATPGSRGSVNVRDLTSHPSTTQRPITTLNLPRPGLTVRGSAVAAPAPAVVGPKVPVDATRTTNPPAGKPGWEGLSRLSGPDTNGEPPDPYLAAGPDHILQTTNASLRVTNRAGSGQVSVSLFDFFGLTSGFENTDPRVMYDPVHGRWLMTEISWLCSASDGHAYGYFDLVVSRTADPYGTWDLWFWEYTAHMPDFGALGWSSDKLGFAANVFAMPEGYGPGCMSQPGATYAGSDIEVFDWADLLANGGPNHVLDTSYFFDPTGHYGAARVAIQSPATTPRLDVILQYTPDAVTYYPYYLAITGSAVADTTDILIEGDLADAGISSGWVEPPSPHQSGNDIVTDAIDSRPTDLIARGSRLLYVSNHGCTPAGDTILRTCVRVTELNTAGVNSTHLPLPKQDFLVSENGKDSYFGGIGLALDGTLHIVWTDSSSTPGDYPTAETAYQLPTDPLRMISPTETLISSTAAYTGARWGDYVGVATDPQVPNGVWQGSEHASGGADWETRVSQLQTGGSSYVPMTPVRILDTRPAYHIGLNGGFTANVPRSFQVNVNAGIPEFAVAVTGNLTVVNQTAPGYVSITTTATANPKSSTINFPIGDNRANNVTIPVGAEGQLSAVYKAPAGKTTHLIFDVTGYFLAGDTNATYAPLAPVRILDSRPAYNIGLTGAFVPNIPRQVSVAGGHGIPADAVAITGNLTVVGQTKAGYLAITPNADSTPDTSTLNFPLGDTRANGVTVPLNGAGTMWIVYKASGGTTHVILDVTGYYRNDPSGLLFYPLTPGRLMDTRPIAVLSRLSGAFAANIPRTLKATSHWGIPASADAITGNLTVVGQTAAGYASITLNPTASPTTSTLNFPLGDTRANGATVPLNGTGSLSFVYKAPGGKATHLIFDVSGYFD